MKCRTNICMILCTLRILTLAVQFRATGILLKTGIPCRSTRSCSTICPFVKSSYSLEKEEEEKKKDCFTKPQKPEKFYKYPSDAEVRT